MGQKRRTSKMLETTTTTDFQLPEMTSFTIATSEIYRSLRQAKLDKQNREKSALKTTESNKSNSRKMMMRNKLSDHLKHLIARVDAMC